MIDLKKRYWAVYNDRFYPLSLLENIRDSSDDLEQMKETIIEEVKAMHFGSVGIFDRELNDWVYKCLDYTGDLDEEMIQEIMKA